MFPPLSQMNKSLFIKIEWSLFLSLIVWRLRWKINWSMIHSIYISGSQWHAIAIITVSNKHGITIIHNLFFWSANKKHIKGINQIFRTFLKQIILYNFTIYKQNEYRLIVVNCTSEHFSFLLPHKNPIFHKKSGLWYRRDSSLLVFYAQNAFWCNICENCINFNREFRKLNC